MRFSHTLSTCKHYVSVSIIVLAMTLFLAGCPSPNDPAPNDSKPLLTITATQASVTEGGTSTFTITRDNVESALEVSLTLSGSAEHNVDYTVDPTVDTDSSTGDKTMTVVFENSKKSVDITITAKNDEDTEATGETVEIEINESDDYTIGNPSTVTLTIVDPLAVGISTSGENNINEGGRISVTITSNQQVPNGLEVILIIAGDATIDEDYALPGITTTTSGGTVTATVTISSGNTETMLTIDATDDSIHELNANLTITISDEPSTYRIKEGEKTVTVTITDDDLPTVGFRTTSQAQTLDEGDAESVTVTVERSNDEVRDPLTVQLSFEDSTATINADYALTGVTTTTLDDTVTIPVGRDTLTFTITGIDDEDVEGDEEVIITISEVPSAYTIDKDNNEVTITIVDDDDTDGDMIPNSEDVDDDNDGLIEIHNLEMLRNVHFNLAGTSYDDEEDDVGTGGPGDTNGAPASQTDHCNTPVDDGVYLCGYELTRNLDFTDKGSYVAGIIKEEWRPNGAGNSNDATNAGFPGIGPKTGLTGGFTGIFEGNGYSISNLYMRNTAATENYNTGLFRLTSSGAKIRNLGMTNVALYGGAGNADQVGGLVGANNAGTITASYASGTVDGGAGNTDNVGGLVGQNFGPITASYASGTVNGGDGDFDTVGGLVGNNSANITASYATGTVDGGAGTDNVGGLVGRNQNGTIIASYASGTVDGGAGNGDTVGGLVGNNRSIITASYATGTVDTGAGDNDRAGGLVGNNVGPITASYATGDVDGGAGDTDYVGGLVGGGSGTFTASYGFGEANVGTAGSDGTTKPDNVNEASDLTSINAGSEWNDADSNTLGAWNFGDTSQNPALKYANYDGDAGSVYSCDQFPETISGTDYPLVWCGTTLLPGQRE